MEFIVAILLLNSLSFVLARLYWRVHGDLATEFITPDDQTPNPELGHVFLIAGTGNQPKPAFAFMEPDLREKGYAFTYLHYKQIGWNARVTADQLRDAITPHEPCTLCTISVGDHVARYLERYTLPKLSVYAINPCPRRKTLQLKWKIALVALAPLAQIVCHLLGWLSLIPVVPSVAGKFSLMLMVDQYWSLAYDHPPRSFTHTRGVVLSRSDEFLDNDQIKREFWTAKSLTIPSKHGDTVDNAPEYWQAMIYLKEQTTVGRS